jgi:uncharacterized protein YutE (UPF0331/DUF86 family)
VLEFNRDKVTKITSEIVGSLKRLDELRNLPQDNFLSDPHKIGSAKYNFIVAIEGIIDLFILLRKIVLELLKIMQIRFELWLKREHLMKNSPLY